MSHAGQAGMALMLVTLYECVATCDEAVHQARTNARMSALITSGCVVHIPCGRPS